MLKNKKIVSFLIAFSIMTASFVNLGYSAKGAEQYLSDIKTTEISEVINDVLSYDQIIMKTGKSKDYSSVINEKKLLQIIQKEEKFKEDWYSSIGFKIYDYTSIVKIDNITQLSSNKYILDVTYQSNLKLNKDSQVDSAMKDYYVFEVENKSGQWVINKMINKDAYQDIINERKSDRNTILGNDNLTELTDKTLNDTAILADNDMFLDAKMKKVEKASANINESVKSYKGMMKKSENISLNGAEKATPAYTGTNRAAIARYSYTYAINHNQSYNYIDGADCTNFASQSSLAGGVPTSTSWKPYTAVWVNVDHFYNYMSGNGYSDPNADMNTITAGDIIQFKHWYSFGYDHSTMVNGYDDTFGWMLNAHSNDRQNWPMANFWADFSSARNLHFK